MRKPIVIIAALLVVLAVGAGSFWAGTKVGENRVIQDPARLFQQGARRQSGELPDQLRTPQPGQRVAQGLGGGIMGTIEGIEGDSLVVSTEEGTIRVQTTDTTLIEKSMTVNVGDLEVGVRWSSRARGTMTGATPLAPSRFYPCANLSSI